MSLTSVFIIDSSDDDTEDCEDDIAVSDSALLMK
jgi:hypothetical protein